MKTAISINDSLLEQTDEAARDHGLSRSGIIAEACVSTCASGSERASPTN